MAYLYYFCGMTRLSVNINKIATLRNARGGNLPDVSLAALKCEQFGAQGITVHPRPDGRHIRYADVYALAPILTTEFNIEGNPTPDFISLVMDVKPAQVTLVPDAHDALTSNAGWDTLKHQKFLQEVTRQFQQKGIRVSLFVDPDVEMVRGAASIGADRVELYTEAYASGYVAEREQAIAPYVLAANAAIQAGLTLNAGHDLNLDNLAYFVQTIPAITEVSIGHALISDALYLGLENSIKAYLKCLA